MNLLAQTIDGMQEILAICPCCGDIFRLVEGKFIFPDKPIKPCEYTKLIALEGKNSDDEEKINLAEERLKEKLDKERKALRDKGRAEAKGKLKKIDPVFSAKDIDPQDVKVIFDPVKYIIFHGSKSESYPTLIEFVSREPNSKAQEKAIKSIDKAIKNGDVNFETLTMRDDGSFNIYKESSAKNS